MENCLKMKRIFQLFVVLMTSAAIFGCSRIPFRTASFEDLVKYPLSDNSEDSLDVAIFFQYPEAKVANPSLATMTSGILSIIFDMPADTAGVEANVMAYEENLAEFYRNECSSSSADSHSWFDYLNGYFSGRWRGFVSYIFEYESFHGGAHPMNTLTASVFRIDTGELVSEGDFFMDGYEKPLGELLTARLPDALENDKDALESIFVPEIAPNGNFEVSSSGITYYYQPYEIGPYYLGVIAVNLPWDEVKGLVRKP